MRVCVDAGHGGIDPGAVGGVPFPVEEKDVNLAIALEVEKQLQRRDWETLLTRRQDRTLSSPARAEFANRYEADVFVSIHANAASTPEVEGMEVFHFPGSQHGRSLALHVLDRMLFRFPGHRNRGVKSANFTILRTTAMPAILVECEFLTHPRQLEFLASSDCQCGLAVAIAHGIDTATRGFFTPPDQQLALDFDAS